MLQLRWFQLLSTFNVQHSTRLYGCTPFEIFLNYFCLKTLTEIDNKIDMNCRYF